jgi:hypothetical protein
MSEELKACPFCNQPARISDVNTGWTIHRCTAHGTEHSPIIMDIELWNNRPAEAELKDTLRQIGHSKTSEANTIRLKLENDQLRADIAALRARLAEAEEALLAVQHELIWLTQISYSEDDGIGGQYWPGDETRKNISAALTLAHDYHAKHSV